MDCWMVKTWKLSETSRKLSQADLILYVRYIDAWIPPDRHVQMQILGFKWVLIFHLVSSWNFFKLES